MSSNLFIPKKLKVGFQKCAGTYQEKLAYIVYYDERGKLRKETSFNNWIEKDLGTVEVDNVPFEGFVLNKSITRYPWDHFGNVTTKIRIFDTRGMEFEITSDNLLGILTCSDCVKRDLRGKFVYAWAGKELVLLPCASEEYRKATEFTAIRTKCLSTRELKEGHTYITRQAIPVLYLGRLTTETTTGKPENFGYGTKKAHIFIEKRRGGTDSFNLHNLVKKDSCSNYISDSYGDGSVHPEFANMYMQYHEDRLRCEPIRKVVLLPIDPVSMRQRLTENRVTLVAPKKQPNRVFTVMAASPAHFPREFDNTDLFHFDEPVELDINTKKLIRLDNYYRNDSFRGYSLTRIATEIELISRQCSDIVLAMRNKPERPTAAFARLRQLCQDVAMPATADSLTTLLDRLLVTGSYINTFVNSGRLYGNVTELSDLCLSVNLEFESGIIQPLTRLACYDQQQC